MKVFIVLIFWFQINSAFAYEYTAEDLATFGKHNYIESFSELNWALSEINKEIIRLERTYQNIHLNSNIYQSSAFHTENRFSVEILIHTLNTVVKYSKFLEAERDKSLQIFKNFEFPFSEFLNDADRRIFNKTYSDLSSVVERQNQLSVNLINEVKDAANELEKSLARRVYKNDFIYVEHAIISKNNSKNLISLLERFRLIEAKATRLYQDVINHQKVAYRIYESYLRKLSFRLGVYNSEQYYSSFKKNVSDVLSEVKKHIIENQISAHKSPFLYSYVLNHLKRALSYSEALNFIASVHLKHVQIKPFAELQIELGSRLLSFKDSPNDIDSIKKFISQHNSPMSCRVLFFN